MIIYLVFAFCQDSLSSGEDMESILIHHIFKPEGLLRAAARDEAMQLLQE